MIRVISSFADGPVNFHSTGPAEDQIQKLISSTALWGDPYLHVYGLYKGVPPPRHVHVAHR